MLPLRAGFVFVLAGSMTVLAQSVAGAPPEPLGILTQAKLANLDASPAFAGLSIYAGECLRSESGGLIALRMDKGTLALAANSEAILARLGDGVHVDLSAGSVHYSAGVSQVVEVHAEEAIVRSPRSGVAEGTVAILAPKVLQLDVRKGDLEFSYRQEFRRLPAGQIYRIYLDSPGEPAGESNASLSTESPHMVTYYILSAGAGGALAWWAYDAAKSGHLPISPSRP